MRIFVKISGSPSVTGLVANSVAYSENDDATIKRISVHRSEPNYTYVIVNSDRNVYFVKSDETYDEGYLSEDYTVALRNVDADLIPSDLVSGGSCYLRTGCSNILREQDMALLLIMNGRSISLIPRISFSPCRLSERRS